MGPSGPQTKNECDGEDHEQFKVQKDLAVNVPP
jgi:hypothetical protein